MGKEEVFLCPFCAAPYREFISVGTVQVKCRYARANCKCEGDDKIMSDWNQELEVCRFCYYKTACPHKDEPNEYCYKINNKQAPEKKGSI